ncbi:MAG TPA: hypothetical protein PLW65_17380 [Pseudomonadota bacterium]|nr:hypothetical protein [Pseudomonadota bacterium]
MHLASSTKHALLALGIGVTLAACGDGGTTPPDNTTYTWTKVSTDIKGSCATVTACHLKGTTQPFTYDNTLTPGSDMANYTVIMAYIDKTAPANSQLITVGKGGQYMGRTHGTNLGATQATNWTNWITAGALFQ